MSRRVSVAIMAHPRREKWIPDLCDALALEDEPRVAWDERNDRWDTGRRAMLAYDPAATHHLVLQDDGLPCSNLIPGLTRALEHVPPDNPVALYLGKVRPHARHVIDQVDRAQKRGHSWIVFEGPWWGVAVVIPVSQIAPMLAWGDAHPEIENYDRRMARYFGTRKLLCYYSNPSLVEHRTEGNPSLIAGRTGQSRSAHHFIGLDRTPDEIDWSKGAPQNVAQRRRRNTMNADSKPGGTVTDDQQRSQEELLGADAPILKEIGRTGTPGADTEPSGSATSRRLPMFDLYHPAGFKVRVAGESRRGEFLKRGYTETPPAKPKARGRT